MTDIALSIASMALSGGVLGALLFYRQKQRKERAEATAAEIDNQSSINEEYRKVTEEWKRIAADTRDELGKAIRQLHEVRADCDKILQENVRLRISAETDKVRLCHVRNCPNREPHTGY